jgi:hypothetical protein
MDMYTPVRTYARTSGIFTSVTYTPSHRYPYPSTCMHACMALHTLLPSRLPYMLTHIPLIREHGGSSLTLSYRSIELLSTDDPEAQAALVRAVAEQPLVQHPCISCMEVVKQCMDDPIAVSMLVVGAEDGGVYVLTPQVDRVVKRVSQSLDRSI